MHKREAAGGQTKKQPRIILNFYVISQFNFHAIKRGCRKNVLLLHYPGGHCLILIGEKGGQPLALQEPFAIKKRCPRAIPVRAGNVATSQHPGKKTKRRRRIPAGSFSW
jgi:hypothetical protein